VAKLQLKAFAASNRFAASYSTAADLHLAHLPLFHSLFSVILCPPLMSAIELTESLLKRRSGNFDLSAISTLSLHHSGLTQLRPILSSCTSLTDLDISNNSISSLQSIDGRRLQKLEFLNASHNALADLHSLSFIPTLRELYLQGNQIDSIDKVSLISSKLPGLRVLALQQLDGSMANPVCKLPGYRAQLLSLLPGLEILDGLLVRSVAEREFTLALNEAESTLASQVAAVKRDLKSKLAENEKLKEKIDEKLSGKGLLEVYRTELKQLQDIQKDDKGRKEIEKRFELVRHWSQDWKKSQYQIETEIEEMKKEFPDLDWDQIERPEIDIGDSDETVQQQTMEETEPNNTSNQSPSLVSREIHTAKLSSIHKKTKAKK
jgi:Leucine-rich repeat (LRR) protein